MQNYTSLTVTDTLTQNIVIMVRCLHTQMDCEQYKGLSKVEVGEGLALVFLWTVTLY